MTKIRSPKNVCSTIGFALFGMMLVWIVFSFILQAAALAVDPALLNNTWAVWLLNDIPLYLMGAPVFLLVLSRIPDGPVYARPQMHFGPGRYLLLVVLCFGTMYVFNLASSIILVVLQALFGGSGTGMEAMADLASGGVLPSLIFGAIVPALGEEFLFRYMLRRKMNGCADLSYILISGLAFALFHANLMQMFYAFALGAIFAWVYLVTNNIWLPVSLHFIINLFGIVIYPAMIENPVGLVIAGVMVLGFIVGGLIIFFLKRREAAAYLQPPTEPGWPHKLPKPVAAFRAGWGVAGQAYGPPYGQGQSAYGHSPYGQKAYTQAAYGQGAYAQAAYGQPGPAAYNPPAVGQAPGQAYRVAYPAAVYPAPVYHAPVHQAPVQQAAYPAYPQQAYQAPAYPSPPGAYGAPYQNGPAYQGQPAYPAQPAQPTYAPAAYYGQGAYAYPYAAAYQGNPAPYQPRQPYYAAYAAPAAPGQRVLGFCIGNAGMVLYLALAGVLTMMTMAALLLMF